jgi:cytochrome oxidase Cu insertion factor (SCO1/SenC/PrrC family)
MGLREIRFFLAMFGCALTLPAPLRAAGAVDDAFAMMRVDPVVPPVPAAHLVLRATDGTSIRLADFKGKVVVIGFLLTN